MEAARRVLKRCRDGTHVSAPAIVYIAPNSRTRVCTFLPRDSGGSLSCEIGLEGVQYWCIFGLSDSLSPFTITEGVATELANFVQIALIPRTFGQVLESFTRRPTNGGTSWLVVVGVLPLWTGIVKAGSTMD